MTVTYDLKNKLPTAEQALSTPHSTREEFGLWLSNNNAEIISPLEAQTCIDRISEFVINKKISCGIWNITSLKSFKKIYQEVMYSSRLRIFDNRTYKTFSLVGQLYAKFLSKKQYENNTQSDTTQGVNETISDQLMPQENSIFVQHTKQTADIEAGEVLFTKEVDLALLRFGFTIPQSVVQMFYSNVNNISLQQDELPIRFRIDNNLYSAKLCKYPHCVQVRYTPNSPIAIALQHTFSRSYELFVNGDKSIHRDYIKVIVTDLNEYEIVCQLYNGMPNNNALITVNKHKANIIPNANDITVFKERIINIIVEYFRCGIRISSSIDFDRFKNFYSDKHKEAFVYNANWFSSLLKTEALIYDGRAYFYEKDIVDKVLSYLKMTDSLCISIDIFFDKLSSELYNFGIFSVEMLKSFIIKYYPNISVKWDYILLDDAASCSDIIKGVFAERESWSFEDLEKRLPYLKSDTIRKAMKNEEYFRVEKSTYTHIDNIDLPDSEGFKIINFLDIQLAEQDYVSAKELNLSKFMDLNPNCSFNTIRDAVFYKFLSNNYEKHGQVITNVGSKLRVLDILEQYCRNATSVSYEEINTLEAKFDPEGRTHSQCLIAAYKTMVRVSEDLFVSDDQVNFDVTRTDEAISLYCQSNFIPLRQLSDFSLFPLVGYTWNSFLLESYIRRFSRVFMFDVRSVNSANIGVIVRKSYKYDSYDDILIYALAMSTVQLDDKRAIGNYLFNNGYIGWSNLGKSENKIIKSAKALREGGMT